MSSFSMDEFHTVMPLGILSRTVESQEQQIVQIGVGTIAPIVLSCNLYLSSITFFFLYCVSLLIGWLDSRLVCIFMISLHL